MLRQDIIAVAVLVWLGLLQVQSAYDGRIIDVEVDDPIPSRIMLLHLIAAFVEPALLRSVLRGAHFVGLDVHSFLLPSKTRGVWTLHFDFR